MLVPEGDFTSLLFPLAVQAERGVTLVSVPVPELAERLDSSFGAVAFSPVQSSTGEVADLDAIEAAAAAAGALTLLDATHAVGWLPFDAGRFDAVACAAYKWLMSPRGTAFLALGERFAERVPPLHANWFAGEEIHESYYGLPLRLSDDARRFDSSPAGSPGSAARRRSSWSSRSGSSGSTSTTSRSRTRSVPASGSSRPTPRSSRSHVPDAASRLARAGIRASTRAGSVRAAFHIHNAGADVEAAVAALSD